jgi:hypothetical protein
VEYAWPESILFPSVPEQDRFSQELWVNHAVSYPVELILLVACYRNWDKLLLDEPFSVWVIA